jgi:hypothetical protein
MLQVKELYEYNFFMLKFKKLMMLSTFLRLSVTSYQLDAYLVMIMQ